MGAQRMLSSLSCAQAQVPLSDVGIFGATDAERAAGVGRMGKEVDILSSLAHPNIVQVGCLRPVGGVCSGCDLVTVMEVSPFEAHGTCQQRADACGMCDV